MARRARCCGGPGSHCTSGTLGSSLWNKSDSRSQIGISVAGDPSSQHLEKLSAVSFEPGYILASLFAVHGGRDAADYCSKRLKEASALCGATLGLRSNCQFSALPR